MSNDNQKPFTAEDVGTRVHSQRFGFGFGTIKKILGPESTYPVFVEFDNCEIIRTFTFEGHYIKNEVSHQDTDPSSIRRLPEEEPAHDPGYVPISLDDLTPEDLAKCAEIAEGKRADSTDAQRLADPNDPRNLIESVADQIAKLHHRNYTGRWFVTVVGDEVRVYEYSGSNELYDDLITYLPLSDSNKELALFVVQAHNTMPAMLARLSQAERMETALRELLGEISHQETGFYINRNCFDAHEGATEAFTEAHEWSMGRVNLTPEPEDKK